jgi:CheY-like chemotaxis protein
MQPESRSDTAAQQPAPAATQDLAPVIRLRPIQTLVVSPDQAFRARAVAVLSALGPVSLAADALAEVEDITRLRSDRQADVVLLDATGCEAIAQEFIAALASTAPRTGVLVVCQHSTAAARTLHALPKWGWTHDLRAGVELAYQAAHPLAGTLGAQRRRSPWQRMAGPLLRRG